MQLAYYHALKVFENIDQVYIMWDDLYANNNLSDRIKLYIPNADVMFFSQLKHTHGEPIGWLRQQYVKLNLHKLFADNEWIILDADTILRSKKIFKQDNKLLFYTDEHDFYIPYFKFIEYAFDLKKENSPSFMSHFALLEREVLENMELFCLQKHNKDLVSVYKEFSKKYPLFSGECPALSEFEAYGLFASKIMGKEFLFPKPIYAFDDTIRMDPKRNAIWDYSASDFVTVYNSTNRDMCLNGEDIKLPKSFYEQHHIILQEDLN
jgi:hypothetical protein